MHPPGPAEATDQWPSPSSRRGHCTQTAQQGAARQGQEGPGGHLPVAGGQQGIQEGWEAGPSVTGADKWTAPQFRKGSRVSISSNRPKVLNQVAELPRGKKTGLEWKLACIHPSVYQKPSPQAPTRAGHSARSGAGWPSAYPHARIWTLNGREKTGQGSRKQLCFKPAPKLAPP